MTSPDDRTARPGTPGTAPDATGWVDVCAVSDLEVNWGEAAIVAGHEYAVFRTNDDRVFVTDHRDPRSGALVMARGIVGRHGERHTVASPLYKETYDLATGECVAGGDHLLPVHPVRLRDGRVLLRPAD
ncbi:nitrite reductase (NAD(P)H) small subunit [Kocuria tytonis]|uniref:Nitrite reductase (NAD(P)H) small subunit n=2 Tax=Kocuria tytonis TaxID=2054280 RepID=A0A495AAN6_9MICC|nr:nitrite reductase (NAD(P)H) small subunit [Kocuria tytonis]